MKRLLLAGFLATTVMFSAHAADMETYSKAVSVPVQVLSWTGFYGGLNAGYAIGSSDPTGFEGGAQLGYNYRIGPSWLIGFETDIQGGRLSGSSTIGAAAVQQQVDWYGTVRARTGLVTLGDSLLMYGTGGFAYGSTSFSSSDGSSLSGVKTGWVAGGGLEYGPKSWGKWSVKAEYLFVDLGSSGIPLATRDVEFQTVKLGVNYRFN